MSARRHVALFSPGWPPGRVPNGIVTYVGHLRPALERLGIGATVLTSHQVAPSDVPSIDVNKLRLPRARQLALIAADKVPSLATPALRLGWFVAQASNELAARGGLDLIEMEESFGGAWYTQQAVDVPVVVRLHGPRFLNAAALGTDSGAEYRVVEEAERRCITEAVGVTAPSLDVLERTRQHYSLPLPDARVIHYPGPIIPAERRWTYEGCDKKSILFVGRFDRHKGGDLIIQAFRELAAALPDVELQFVGPDRGFVDDEGRTHKLPEYLEAQLPASARARVHVHGQLDAARIEALRRQARITVIPSRYETFGFTVAEALAYACPTVAADSGGMREVLLGDRTGLMFRPGDAADLSAKIRVLWDNPERAADFGRAGALDTSTRLDPDTIARASLEFYETLWAKPAWRARATSRTRLGRLAYQATSLV